MKRQDIKGLIKSISGPNSPTIDRGDWVSSTCPLAPYTHEGGTDSNPSFGIKVNDEGASVYNCLTCKKKGTVTLLLKKLEGFTGENYTDMISEVETEELLGSELPSWEADRGRVIDTLGEPLSEDYLDIYDEAIDHPYVKQRGINNDTAKELLLKVDYESREGERILFPVFSPEGALHGFTGRSVLRDIEPRVRDYHGLPKRLLLLGADHIKPQDGFIIIVEGLFDFAKLFQYGFPVVAVMHSTLTDPQADILKNFGKPVYCMFDNDQAGSEGLAVVIKQLSGFVPVLKVRYPRVYPGYIKKDRREVVRGKVKDPDGLTANEVDYMLRNSRIAA